MSERVLSGAPASPGLAIGRARVLSHPSEDPARDPLLPAEVQAEAERATDALRKAAAELERIAADLRKQGSDDDAEIVETGALMAADPVLHSAVRAAVTERGLRAAAALTDAAEEHALAIASLPDALLAARADDVRSLGLRPEHPSMRGRTARLSCSWPRTSARRTWLSTATGSRGSPCPRAR